MDGVRVNWDRHLVSRIQVRYTHGCIFEGFSREESLKGICPMCVALC